MNEMELVRAAKEGNQQAMSELYEMHKGLLIFHAGRENPRSALSFEDIMSVGHEQFMLSIQSFKEDGGTTFGQWMGGNIYHAVSLERVKSRFWKINASSHVLRRVASVISGRNVDTPHKFDNAAYEYMSTRVIDGDVVPPLDYNGETIMANVWDNKEEPFRDTQRVRELVESLPSKAQGVPSIQRKVVQLYMMDYKWSEIGDMLNVSRQAAQQSFMQAVKGMRRKLNVSH